MLQRIDLVEERNVLVEQFDELQNESIFQKNTLVKNLTGPVEEQNTTFGSFLANAKSKTSGTFGSWW